MSRFKMTFAYDGSAFLGSQKQLKGRTVEEEINKALFKIHKKEVIIYTSGRTDKGVHALNQVAHFDSFLDMDNKKFLTALNNLMPTDIIIKEIVKVDSTFHARHMAKKKEYVYVLTKKHDLFLRNYKSFIKGTLDVNIMIKAIKSFVGTHDFFAFSVFVKDKPTVKTIYEAKIEEKDDDIIITFIGDNFLRQMIRRMVGTLVEIGLGRKDEKIIEEIFLTNDKSLTGRTIEPNGLYLKKVLY